MVGYRQDLAQADVVLFSLTSTVGVTSVRWELVGRPFGSAAGGAGPEPVSLGTGLTASITVDSDAGAFKLDGSYKVQAVLNPGAPSETRKTVVAARLSGLTVPGPGAGTVPLRREAGFEALEDTSISTTRQGWATQENLWKALVQQLTVGGGLTETLSGAYNSGVVSADQTLGLSDSKGGGLVVDGSGGGFTGTSALRVATAAGAMSLTVVRASGRVGIGTSAPAKDLQVSSTAPAVRLDDTNGVAFDLTNDASVLTISAPGGPTTVATFPAAGGMRTDFGVGIGAAAPTAAALAMGAGSGVAVSAANTGRLRYNESTQHWEISENGGAFTTISTGGGGGAPVGASYLVVALDGTLTNERRFIADPDNRLSTGDGGPNADYVISVVLGFGIAGGDTLAGGSLAGDNLTLTSTAHATKGKVVFGFAGTSAYDEVNDRLGIGTASPAVDLVLAGASTQAAAQLADGQNVAVSPTNTGRLRFNAATEHFEISENAGAWTRVAAGATAPPDAQYLTLATSASLSAERVFTPSSRLSAVDGGANGSYTLSVVLATGIAGGDQLAGGTAASETLTLVSTSNATKGKILFGTSAYDEANNRLGVGTTTPSVVLDATGSNSRTALAMTDGQAVAVSGASAGRLRYNAATQHWEISENGGAYFALQSAGSGGVTGTNFDRVTTTNGLVTAGTTYAFTTGSVLITTVSNPVDQDNARFFYTTATVSATTVPRLQVGTNAALSNTTNIGTALHVYNPVTTLGNLSLFRLQANNGGSIIQMVTGPTGGTELPLGILQTSTFGSTFGSLDVFTYFNSGSFSTSQAASFQSGGLRVFGPVWLDTLGAIDTSPDLRNTAMVHWRAGNSVPSSISHTARMFFVDGNGGTTTPRLRLWQNAASGHRPVAMFGHGTDKASASTFVPSSDGWFQHVTGTTTINFVDFFDFWPDGDPLLLYFNSALTLTHDAASPPTNSFPMLLAGATSATMAAGDRIVMVRDTALAHWVEVCRSGPSTVPAVSLTSGSVVFSGGGAVLSQDNANFFWDNTNKRLGIGTAAPSAPLTIARSDSGVAVRLSQAAGQAIAKSGGVLTVGTTDSNFMNFQTGGSTRVRIEAAGAMSFTAAGEPASGDTQFFVRNTATVASGASAVFNGTHWEAASVSITGGTNITTAAGFNAFQIEAPSYNGTVTITSAATLVVVGPPGITGGGAITNAYAFWVQAGAARFDGTVILPDLSLGRGPEDEGEWTLREGGDCIRALNRRTGRWYRLRMEEDPAYAG